MESMVRIAVLFSTHPTENDALCELHNFRREHLCSQGWKPIRDDIKQIDEHNWSISACYEWK